MGISHFGKPAAADGRLAHTRTGCYLNG